MRKQNFKILAISIFASVYFCATYAQQPFYRMELGAWAGASSETSSTFYNTLRPAYGAMFRYKFDKRWSLRLDGGIYNLYSVSNDIVAKKQKKYTNSLITSDLVVEFNFFDYEINEFNRNSRRFSPYIFAGIGATSYEFESKREFAPLIPFGVGFKYKIAPRWNFNIQYIHYLSFTDRLDGVYSLSDINEVKGSNFLNKDMISAITFGITFDFWRYTRHCFCE
ncbi:MAG: porin family protein [Paludibacter sp.]|nr:porin family protein [Paludibacter sp.]